MVGTKLIFIVLLPLFALNCSLAAPKDPIVSENSPNTTTFPEIKPITGREDNNNTNIVTIYALSNFFGLHWTLEAPGCIDIPAFFYKKISSIDTHDNCFILYNRQNCQGWKVRIAPGTKGHSSLSLIDFDKQLVSLKPCKDSNNNSSLITKKVKQGKPKSKEVIKDKREKRSPLDNESNLNNPSQALANMPCIDTKNNQTQDTPSIQQQSSSGTASSDSSTIATDEQNLQETKSNNSSILITSVIY